MTWTLSLRNFPHEPLNFPKGGNTKCASAGLQAILQNKAAKTKKAKRARYVDVRR